MDGSLFVADKDMSYAVFEIAELVIYGYDLAARISENSVDTFRYEGKPHCF